MKTDATTWEASIEWTRIVTGCIIYRDKKYLLVQEKQPKAYGLWNLPAGHVDKGESIETAAIREAKEETGYDVALVERLAIYHEETTAPIKHVFLATIIGGEPTIDEDEILQIKWLSYDEIVSLHAEDKIRASWVWNVITYHHHLHHDSSAKQ